MAKIVTKISKINVAGIGNDALFGDVVYVPGSSFGPRQQLDYQLLLFYTGNSSVGVGGKTIVLPKRSVTLMLPGFQETYSYAPDIQTHHRWCEVSPSHLPPNLVNRLQVAPKQIPLSTHLHDLIELGLTIPAPETDQAMGLVRQLALTTLWQFCYDAERQINESELPPTIIRAQQFIATHLGSPLQISDIAESVNVTPQHLIKLFNKYLGQTPAKYLWLARVMRGAELLRGTGLSISEIADRTGFQNPFHFSRLIKQHHGCSPKHLRERAWNNSD
jgi:AraC family transcriptional regulator, arabinose operon regulatory protein